MIKAVIIALFVCGCATGGIGKGQETVLRKYEVPITIDGDYN